MLDPDEAASIEAAYGVPTSQVQLDHMISHILGAIASLDLPLAFFGGTALARTHLADPPLVADSPRTSISTVPHAAG